jgi:hypothetical protein
MALNTDFRVKNSLYVGNSACFVGQINAPTILSAGVELFDIFLQEGEASAQELLSGGTAITPFSYDGSVVTEISLDSTCNTNWNAAYDWCTANSATVLSAAEYVAVNGGNAIDSIVEGAGQGQIAIDDVSGSGPTQVDVNGMQTGDSPAFAGVTAGNVTVGTGDNNTVSTCSGGLTIDSTTGETTIADNLTVTGTVQFDGVTTGTSNTVVVSSGGNLATDEIDPKVWAGSLIDGSGTTGQISKFSASGTLTDSGITEDVNGIQITGGLSATGTLSGDGSGLTGVTATPSFPTVGATDLATSDKIFVNDGASCETACNKHITYGNFLIDLAGTNAGLEVDATDSLALKNYTGLTDGQVTKWDDTNGQFVDSIMQETALGNITIAGGATITGNLSVQGDLTCIDTILQTTSAVCIENAGTGPALYAEQTGVSQPIAQFVDTEGGQVVISDGGNVGIGTIGLDPAEALTVSGNISSNGDLTIRGTSNLLGAVCMSLGAGTDDSVVINTGSGLATDEIDSKVWAQKLVDYGTTTANTIPRYCNGTGTVGNSNITDNDSLVTIDSDTKINDGHVFQVYAGNGTNYTQQGTFTAVVSGGDGYNLPTFPKANLRQVKYEVTLVNGVNVTSFEVNAVYNGTDPCGTTYAIVDAQAASQLADIEISAANSTIDLDITSAASSTTAIVHGTALY